VDRIRLSAIFADATDIRCTALHCIDLITELH
jgi:hypothetical protein